MSVALTAPAVRAQSLTRVPRIGVLNPQKSTESPRCQREPFERGLRERVGCWNRSHRRISVRRGSARRPAAARGGAGGTEGDVIVARGPQAIRAASPSDDHHPIVMSAGPTRYEAVSSRAWLGRAAYHGLALFADDLGGKQLQILKEAVPELSRVAVLVNPIMSPTQDESFSSRRQPGGPSVQGSDSGLPEHPGPTRSPRRSPR